MDIKTDYDKGAQRLIDFVKTIKPDLTETEIAIIRNELRSITVEAILNIGNSIHSLPKQIRN